MSSRHTSRSKPTLPTLDKYQKNEIEKAFVIFDSDKSGNIDRHELTAALRAMGFELTKEDINRIMDDFDKGGKGYLNKDEFTRACSEKMAKRDPNEDIARSFSLFDYDNNKKIGFKDLMNAVKDTGLNFNQKTIESMICEFDLDGDGEISIEEFYQIMTQGAN